MEICHHVQLHHRVQQAFIADLCTTGGQPLPIFWTETAREFQLCQDLQVGHQLLSPALTDPVLFQLTLLPPQVEDQPLIGKERQLMSRLPTVARIFWLLSYGNTNILISIPTPRPIAVSQIRPRA